MMRPVSILHDASSDRMYSAEPALQVLANKKIHCVLHSASQIPSEQQMQVVVLKDGTEQLGVILPRNHMLDLRMLNASLDTNFRADIHKTLELKHRLHAYDLPAIPQLLNCPCIYAASLNHLPQLYIESGSVGQLIALSAEQFSTLMHSARPLTFSIELAAQNPNLVPAADDLKHIQQAVQSVAKIRIQQRLESTVEIPPLSLTAKKILNLRSNPHASVDELTSIVETDPAMAAQVMSWASSPYYATQIKVRSIEDAIVRVLGFDLVINLALGLALGKSLQLPLDTRQNRSYWQQAVYTAALIEGLVRIMPRHLRPEPGLAYLAGLLHSFGYALLAHLFPAYFTLISDYLDANPHVPACFIEHHLLGITREQMGAWLMQHWQMPDELTVAIRQQHNPSYQGEHAGYAQLTFLATHILNGSDGLTRIPDQLLQQLGISVDDASDALNKVIAAEQALRNLASQISA